MGEMKKYAYKFFLEMALNNQFFIKLPFCFVQVMFPLFKTEIFLKENPSMNVNNKESRF